MVDYANTNVLKELKGNVPDFKLKQEPLLLGSSVLNEGEY